MPPYAGLMAAAMGYYPDTDKWGCGRKIRQPQPARFATLHLKCLSGVQIRKSILVLRNSEISDDIVRETEHNEFQRLLDLWIPRPLICPHLQRNGIGILAQ